MEKGTDSLKRKIAIVSYPRLNEIDRAWFETIRLRHDPQAELIPAHLTLLFPVIANIELLLSHAGHCAAVHHIFDIRMTRAQPYRDHMNSRSCVFILPTTGSENITSLHDCLYSGEFRGDLRKDLPYQPHVTVARKSRYVECAALASSLNDRGIDIPGRLETISVIAIQPASITPLAEFDLGRPMAAF
ncbi:MAG: 2'-5' RNA ligase family protein [Acidobacteriota bacterium]